jgi:hypothetical protein
MGLTAEDAKTDSGEVLYGDVARGMKEARTRDTT